MANMIRALRVSLNYRPAGRCRHTWPQYIEF
jgi:hypothetical protein